MKRNVPTAGADPLFKTCNVLAFDRQQKTRSVVCGCKCTIPFAWITATLKVCAQ